MAAVYQKMKGLKYKVGAAGRGGIVNVNGEVIGEKEKWQVYNFQKLQISCEASIYRDSRA